MVLELLGNYLVEGLMIINVDRKVKREEKNIFYNVEKIR